MKSVPKLIARFIGILLLSVILLAIINIALLGLILFKQFPDSSSNSDSPYQYAQTVADNLTKTGDSFSLDVNDSTTLKKENIWAVLIDENSKQVIWHTENLPNNVPNSYTLSDISSLTSGYIEGYPTYTGSSNDGLVVLGYPKKSYWKHTTPTWKYKFIANLPQIFMIALSINVILILFIYLWFTGKLTRSVNPIVQSIKDLPKSKRVKLNEKGALSEIAVNINQTSRILQDQEKELKKKEVARADWIAGISHDIRTPLSMVLGYTSQLENSQTLSTENKQKTKVILRQSEKIRNLVDDLNLSSKLEYSMQPLNTTQVNMVALVRQVVVDFMNNDIEDKYAIEWLTEESLSSCMVYADKDLLKRAITNLIQNGINHNPEGCTIYVTVKQQSEQCVIQVEDNGVGITDAQLEKLNHSPHYMISRDSGLEQRHGLGLLIVKQIVESHNGKMTLGHSHYGGLSVCINLP